MEMNFIYNATFHSTDAVVVSNAVYGPGTGPVYVNNLACIGSEINILQCNYDEDTTDCTHTQDAGVQCQRESI